MKVLIVLIFCVVATASAYKCFPVSKFCSGAHQEYSDCNAKPSCQPTCEFPDGRICTKECVAGCKCKTGYVEDENRNCIKKEACPAVQPICRLEEHKVYTDCGAYPSCQKTCETPDGPQICPYICAPGCVCEEGYVQDSEGNCVLPEACPTIQPICSAAEHKVYTECNARCPIKTCDNPEGPQICPLICVSGCVCEDGYVQDKDGNCVTIDSCPEERAVCSAAEHKVYSECDAMCQKTCENPNPMICPAICAAGCVCEEGYLQDSNGNCVLPEECPAIQPICRLEDHTVYTECDAYGPNQKTCENPDGPIAIAEICMSGCICEDGYVQDSDGKCVLLEECPTQPIDPAICFLPQVSGPCKAYMPSWGYNTETGTCTEFIYGGCQGNENRFATEEQCNQACSNIQPIDPAICLLPQETGPCRAYFPSWGYNSETGTCTEFVYGGCQGNANRFTSEAECNSACVN